jgi:hypothetical protein
LNGHNDSASIEQQRDGTIQAEAKTALLAGTGANAALLSPTAACHAVKRKPRTPPPARLPEPPGTDDPNHESARPLHKFSHAHLDKMAADIEKGIRDLPVWKDLVARVGFKEARKILRQGILMNWITDGNPGN